MSNLSRSPFYRRLDERLGFYPLFPMSTMGLRRLTNSAAAGPAKGSERRAEQARGTSYG